MIDEMAAGEASGARDQRRASHVGSLHAPSAVLRVVVSAEGGIVFLNRPPPRLVLPVPGDGVTQTGIERNLGTPVECLQLRGVEGVAPVVPRPVDDRLNQRFGF